MRGESHSPLTRMVVGRLRDRILSGALAGGERLVEGRLSEEMGVSRMPVRETLQGEGKFLFDRPRRSVATRLI